MSRLRSVIPAVCLLVGCSGSLPTLDEIEGQAFSSVRAFVESISCSEVFETTASLSGEPEVIEDEDEALAQANSLLAGPRSGVSSVARAGNVWLLIDAEGDVFAAMDLTGSGASGCLVNS